MAPIKVEQDSDSENGCDPYGRPWSCRDPLVLDRRYGDGGYDAGVHLKAEADYYDPRFSPCQRGKAGVSPPYSNGHYQSYSGVAHPNAGGRPLKCVVDKAHAHAHAHGHGQFSPQQLSHADPLCGSQTANCGDGHLYPAQAMGPQHHKGYLQPDYSNKLGPGYEFKGHGLVHSIKREPMDSPPWSDGGHEMGQTMALVQRSAVPMMSPTHHKANPYLYMQ
ncbi:uncharacterized protein FYW47_014005 [Aplochiton taeniatus]